MTEVLSDIVLSVFNGEHYLAEQVESIRAQTHGRWRLWIRDDGSTDGSREIATGLARADERIRVLPPKEGNLGLARSCGRLLLSLPSDTCYVFCCDADDFWLPTKMEVSLAALRAREAVAPGPILLHTDLVVTDATLQVIHPSYWEFLGIDPDNTELAGLLVRNVATAPTQLINRPLLDRLVADWDEPIPGDACHQDWWITLVAGAFGRIVALPQGTVLYRRHEANMTGDLSGVPTGLGETWRRLLASRAKQAAVREDIDAVSRQAAAFQRRYRSQLPATVVDTLSELAALRNASTWARKLSVLRHFTLEERGLLSNLGLVLRA